jgi:hypothetical protein
LIKLSFLNANILIYKKFTGVRDLEDYRHFSLKFISETWRTVKNLTIEFFLKTKTCILLVGYYDYSCQTDRLIRFLLHAPEMSGNSYKIPEGSNKNMQFVRNNLNLRKVIIINKFLFWKHLCRKKSILNCLRNFLMKLKNLVVSTLHS